MKNNKGFTLIELLAVITIMGILMIVAIPTISRTIENTRKDMFVDLAHKYAGGVKNMWTADSLECDGVPSSAVKAGAYYVRVDTTDSSLPNILEQGGKSPWGNRDIKGIVMIAVFSRNDSRTIRFFPVLVDDIHGINISEDGSRVKTTAYANNLKRNHVVMNNAKYSLFIDASGNFIPSVVANMDINGDGDKDDVIDGVSETDTQLVLCVER